MWEELKEMIFRTTPDKTYISLIKIDIKNIEEKYEEVQGE
jgi:hypothetical protein